MVNYKNFKKNYKENELGLKYFPSIEPEFSDSSDFIDGIIDAPITLIQTNGNGQFSKENGEILKELMLKTNPDVVVEIGIARHHRFSNSSTHTLFDNKKENCKYFGIDLDYTGIYEYETYQPNIKLLIGNSGDQNIIDVVKNNSPIDILLIDGDHSINGFLQDWEYVKYVRKGGFIVCHDTNNHPGPFYFYDAIDENKFNKFRYFENRYDDNGLAVFEKLF